MSKKALLTISFFAIGLTGLFFSLRQAHVGANFQANNLIDDSVFDQAGSMNAGQIDTWLNANFPNSCISTNHGFAAPDPTGYSSSTGYTYGGAVSAGKVIYDAAQAYGINPQVLLATLQKEEGLVAGNGPYGCSALAISASVGYGCPDSGSSYSYSNMNPPLYYSNGTAVTSVSGTCVNSVSKAGFSQQIIHAAWLLKFGEQRSEGNVNWAVVKGSWDNSDDLNSCYGGPMTQGYRKRCPFDSSPVYYDGFITIDNQSVHMDTGATAALYWYTPHFHGNQSFVTIFETWFGGAADEGYVLATSSADNGDTRQWVVYHGVKHLVPNTDVLQAWGLDKVALFQWPGSYLGSYQTGQDLGYLMRPTATQDVYFVDGGNCFKVTSSAMLNAWNFNPASILDVSINLGQVPANQGNLAYAIKDASDASGAIYMVDGGKVRHYSGPDILHAWEGDNATFNSISHTYFSKMGTGTDVNTTKVTDGSAGATEYQVVSGQKLPESLGVAQLYPGTAITASTSTLNRLVTSAPATQFVRKAGGTTIYLVDSSTKHPISSPNLVRAWGVGANPIIDDVTQGNLNLLTSGTTLNTYEADVGGQLYVMDGRKITVPAGLDSAYRTTSNVYSASAALMSISPAGETISNFIKGFNSPSIYLMDANNLRNIRTPSDLTLWNNGGNITSVSDYVLGQFSSSTPVGAYVTDGTTEYVMESGAKHTVSSSVKSNWQISNPDTVSTATLGRFASGNALSNQLKGNGQYYLVHEGAAYMTVDTNVADAWGISGAPTMNTALVPEFLKLNMMTRFAKSKLSNDSRLFTVNNGTLYHLSPQQAGNLGLTVNDPLMAVNPEAITASISDWTATVVQDSAGKAYVIDGGNKRPFPSSTVQNFWTNNGTITPPQMTNGFLNLLPTGKFIERAVKGSSANIYAGQDQTKRWIQSWNTYQTSYAPYTQVNDNLLNSLPDGSNIP